MPRPIRTVTGEIQSTELGFVLPHEHIFHDMYEITMNSQLILSDKTVAKRELKAYRDAGGDTLVDQTIYGLHPEPELVAEVARDVGVYVILGTGFYWEKFHPHWLAGMSHREIVALLVAN